MAKSIVRLIALLLPLSLVQDPALAATRGAQRVARPTDRDSPPGAWSVASTRFAEQAVTPPAVNERRPFSTTARTAEVNWSRAFGDDPALARRVRFMLTREEVPILYEIRRQLEDLYRKGRMTFSGDWRDNPPVIAVALNRLAFELTYLQPVLPLEPIQCSWISLPDLRLWDSAVEFQKVRVSHRGPWSYEVAAQRDAVRPDDPDSLDRFFTLQAGRIAQMYLREQLKLSPGSESPADWVIRATAFAGDLLRVERDAWLEKGHPNFREAKLPAHTLEDVIGTRLNVSIVDLLRNWNPSRSRRLMARQVRAINRGMISLPLRNPEGQRQEQGEAVGLLNEIVDIGAAARLIARSPSPVGTDTLPEQRKRAEQFLGNLWDLGRFERMRAMGLNLAPLQQWLIDHAKIPLDSKEGRQAAASLARTVDAVGMPAAVRLAGAAMSYFDPLRRYLAPEQAPQMAALAIEHWITELKNALAGTWSSAFGFSEPMLRDFVALLPWVIQIKDGSERAWVLGHWNPEFAKIVTQTILADLEARVMQPIELWITAVDLWVSGEASLDEIRLYITAHGISPDQAEAGLRGAAIAGGFAYRPHALGGAA